MQKLCEAVAKAYLVGFYEGQISAEITPPSIESLIKGIKESKEYDDEHCG